MENNIVPLHSLNPGDKFHKPHDPVEYEYLGSSDVEGFGRYTDGLEYYRMSDQLFVYPA